MKLMKDMTKDEMIELVAAVSLRIYGFAFAIAAFGLVCHLSLYLNHNSTTLTRTAIASSNTINGYIMDIAFNTLMSAVAFLLTVPLARLLCRGLSHALKQKPLE